jgi:hypothetical protein
VKRKDQETDVLGVLVYQVLAKELVFFDLGAEELRESSLLQTSATHNDEKMGSRKVLKSPGVAQRHCNATIRRRRALRQTDTRYDLRRVF